MVVSWLQDKTERHRAWRGQLLATWETGDSAGRSQEEESPGHAPRDLLQTTPTTIMPHPATFSIRPRPQTSSHAPRDLLQQATPTTKSHPQQSPPPQAPPPHNQAALNSLHPVTFQKHRLWSREILGASLGVNLNILVQGQLVLSALLRQLIFNLQGQTSSNCQPRLDPGTREHFQASFPTPTPALLQGRVGPRRLRPFPGL